MSISSPRQPPTLITDDLSLTEKKNILADFLIDRYSAIAAYSSQVGTTPAGIWVDRKFSRSTNRGMLYFFNLVILGFYVAHYYFHTVSQAVAKDEASPRHSLIYVLLFLGVSAALLLGRIALKGFAYLVFTHRFTKANRSDFLKILSRSEYQSVIANEVEESAVHNLAEPKWRFIPLR